MADQANTTWTEWIFSLKIIQSVFERDIASLINSRITRKWGEEGSLQDSADDPLMICCKHRWRRDRGDFKQELRNSMEGF